MNDTQNTAADDEWQNWQVLGDPVLHIQLRDWADLFICAPLSAHTLAKLAQGLCDDTLTCVARAWDFKMGHDSGTCGRDEQDELAGGSKPWLLAPAMNTAMWQHPLTRQQLNTIQAFSKHKRKAPCGGGAACTTTVGGTTSNIQVIEPISKLLACGDTGIGALASVDSILEMVDTYWKARRPTT
jgi:phosphopantothenoylcysteine decarboxylase